LCEYLCVPCFCLLKRQSAFSRQTRTINSILLLSYILISWLKHQAEFDISVQFVMHAPPFYRIRAIDDYSLFAADYSLSDCCGLVVCLPLGLPVVRRFDLSGQAKYFFIPFKGTSKTNNKNNIKIKKYIYQKKKKKRKKEMKSKFKSATTDRQYRYHKHY